MKLWSKRYSFARGTHWKLERECTLETAAQWLQVFQQDEPMVEFKVMRDKPKT